MRIIDGKLETQDMMTQRRATFFVYQLMTEERSSISRNIFLRSRHQGWGTVDGNGKGVNRINVGSKVSNNNIIMRLSLLFFQQ
jgi:hypothetical protein